MSDSRKSTVVRQNRNGKALVAKVGDHWDAAVFKRDPDGMYVPHACKAGFATFDEAAAWCDVHMPR